MLESADITLLIAENFCLDDISENPGPFEELMEILSESETPDALLADTSCVIGIMHSCHGVSRVEALQWILAYSKYLEEVPIRYLMREGYILGRSSVVLAADAHDAERRTGIAAAAPHNVVSLDEARARRRRKC